MSTKINVTIRPHIKFTPTVQGLPIGLPGLSAYQLYALTTTDNPVLTQEQWNVAHFGVPAEFNTSETHIQWRLVGDEEWIDLIALSNLKGPAFTYADFTPEQLEALRGPAGADAVLPENIVIDANYNNYSTEEKALVATIPNKVDKLTGYSLVADSEILKIHSRNTDSTLLSENGQHSVYIDNAGVFHVKDISQVGTLYVTHAEQIYTTKNEIILRDGAVAGLGVGEYAGFRAKLYDGVNDGHFVFDRDGWARVGDVGSLQKLATIEESPTNGFLMKYNAANFRLESIDPLLLPVSTAMQTALGLKANLSGGNTFSGTQIITATTGNALEIKGSDNTRRAYFDNYGDLFTVNGYNSNGFTLSNVAWYLNNTVSLLWSSTTNKNETKDLGFKRNAPGILEINNGTAGTFAGLKLATLYANKIVPNSDTTGIVLRNAADSADVVYVDLTNKKLRFYGSQLYVNSPAGSSTIQLVNGSDIGSLIRVQGGSYEETVFQNSNTNANYKFYAYTSLLATLNTTGFGLGIAPESKLDINGATTFRDYTYFNNGTHTGDAVGDFRVKVLSGVLTFQKCDVGNSTRGNGTWTTVYTI